MFFKSKEKKAEQDIVDMMLVQKVEIQKRLAMASELNEQLAAVVEETKNLSYDVMAKLKKELKIAKKSLTSVCKKLKEGVMMVDSEGYVIEINHSGMKMLGLESTTRLHVTDIVAWVQCEGDERSVISVDFFSRLSHLLMNRRAKRLRAEYSNDRTLLNELLPNVIVAEHEMCVDLYLSQQSREERFYLTFSVLDNDPEALEDVSYIFLFRTENQRVGDPTAPKSLHA